MLEDAPSSGRPVEIDGDQIETLIDSTSVALYRRQPVSEYPDQALTVTCTRLVVSITLMLRFHVSEVKKPRPCMFM